MCGTTAPKSASRRNSGNAMEFTSLTVVVGANDEKNTLIETVETVMRLAADDMEKILLVRPAKVSDGCLAAINKLEQKYPGIAVDFVQTHLIQL